MTECELISATISSPVGGWTMWACENGIHRVKMESKVNNENFIKKGQDEVKVVTSDFKNKNRYLDDFLQWMIQYFEEKSEPKIEVKICPEVIGTDPKSRSFRQNVWFNLKEKVEFGSTVSYGQLAELSGHPGASRAVGSAMANNPVSLVVPCHRVVKSDGKTGNYSGGTKNDVKVWLLDHENGKKGQRKRKLEE